MLSKARAAGYAGSDRNFRRLVAQERRRKAQVNAHARRPAVWVPGEHLVIDWGVVAGVHVFCAVLAWSRVRFAADKKQDTTLRLLEECFEALSRVPAVVLTGRMGCLKGRVVGDVSGHSDHARRQHGQALGLIDARPEPGSWALLR